MGMVFCDATGLFMIWEVILGAPSSGLLLMLSAPAAMPISMVPAAIWCAMVCTASSFEEQERFVTLAAVVTG